MTSPTVSIIVPFYEVEDYLADCLYSIRQQEFEDFECICVNDATLDNSMEIAKAFRDADPRFSIVVNDRNRGLGGARNAGLQVARGRYVQFVDSDDWIDREMTARLVARIEKTGVDMAFCAMRLHENGKTHTAKPFHDASTRHLALLGPVDLAATPNALWTSILQRGWRYGVVISSSNLARHFRRTACSRIMRSSTAMVSAVAQSVMSICRCIIIEEVVTGKSRPRIRRGCLIS